MDLTGDIAMKDAFASAANVRDVPLKTLDLAAAGLVDFYEADAILPVSYTHLTLPTNREV